MGTFPDIRRLHDRWAHGSVVPVLDQLDAAANAAEDRSERLALLGLEARFCAHSGLLPSAETMFRRISAESLNGVSLSTRCLLYYCLGYYEYEVKRNFPKAAALLAESLKLARRQPPTRDTQLLITAAYWRMASIAQSNGDANTYRIYIDAASGIAEESADAHMRGVVFLARGDRSLGVGLLTEAYDNLLQGLFCVGYSPESIPHYLHAELLLGFAVLELERLRRCPDGAALLNCAQTIDKVRPALSKGKGWIVTPYAGGAVISPSDLLSKVFDLDKRVAGARPRLTREVEARVKRAFDDRCVWCGCSKKTTIDHIIPREWGGTEWEGNLRVLCRSCNSSRKHYFTCVDLQGYLQLKVGVGDEMISL